MQTFLCTIFFIIIELLTISFILYMVLVGAYLIQDDLATVTNRQKQFLKIRNCLVAYLLQTQKN